MIPTPTHVVARPFFAAGADRIPGEAVDVSGWRHVAHFEGQGQLRLLRAGEETIACDCGRMWLDAEKAADHCQKSPAAATTKKPAAAKA